MSFVLIATSTGDDLIPSKDTVVAESSDRKTLEQLRDERAKSRADWLATHEVQWWVVESVIAAERIEQVSSL